MKAEASDAEVRELCETLRVGRGRFRLIEPLGRGGMGEVWLAEDLQLNRKLVALKFVRPEWRHNAAFIEHLREELLRTRDLQHECIIKVHDWHEEKEEPVFLSMEYVPSTSLHIVLEHASGGRLRYAEFLPLFTDVCSALIHAHESAGLIHRDLKPGNILVVSSGSLSRAKVADFGLATATHPGGEMEPSQEHVVGTAPYMSPHQWQGMQPTRKDDVFGLGATMYHALTGNYPFGPRGCRDESYRGFVEPGSYPDVPLKVKLIINRCLERDEAGRPSTVREVLTVLKNNTPLVAPIASSPARTTTPAIGFSEVIDSNATASRLRDFFWWTLFVMLVVSGVVAFYLRPAPETVRRAPIPRDPQRRSNATPMVVIVPDVAAKPTFGAMAVSISGQNAEKDCRLEWMGGGGFSHVVDQLQSIPAGAGNLRRILEPRIPTGPCTVRLDWAGKTVLTALVDVGNDTTNAVHFWIDSRDLSRGDPFVLVTPQPKGTMIEMMQGSRPLVKQSDMVLYTGNLSVRLKAPGFAEVITNLSVTGDLLKSNLTLRLAPSPYPLTDESFSNRLGLVFYPLLSPSEKQRFWCAHTEVTERMYREFEQQVSVMKWAERLRYFTNADRTFGANHSAFTNLDVPVVGVTRAEALRFCEWLTVTERETNRLTPSQRYAIPTVVQWRSAIREFSPKGLAISNNAGSELLQTRWPWRHLIVSESSNSAPFLASAQITRSLDDEHMLFHMTGNVREWCQDTYTSKLNTNADLARYPRTLAGDSGLPEFGVSCGGSWYDNDPHLLDGTLCVKVPTSERSDVLGFRLVIVEPISESALDPAAK